MAPKSGHRRILSDVTHSAVFGVPVSKSTQLLQAAAAEASLNKSKSASTTPSGSPCSSQQSVYHPGGAEALSALATPNTQASWNPFGDDNFSKLTAEELLNKDFAKLAEAGEKATGSTENLIPGLIAFPAERSADIIKAGSALLTAPDPLNSLSDTTEKLIDGQPFPLLRDLLTLPNPFSTAAESSINVKTEMCIDSLIPGLGAPQSQRLSGQPELIPSSVPDSLIGEDSLLGCDLLSHSCPPGNQSVSALPPSSSSSCPSAHPGCGSASCLEELLPGQGASDVQRQSNGYSVLGEGRETEPPQADSQANEGCVHSSDEEDCYGEEEEEEQAYREAQQDEDAVDSHAAAHDFSGSRPLLLDSEDEEDQGPDLALHSSSSSSSSSPHCSARPTAQPSATFHQPTPSTFAQNHSQHEAAIGACVAADVFSKAPFRSVQDEAADVFANAPFPRAPLAARQPFDVFSQAPFGKRKENVGGQHSHPHAAGVHSVSPDQGALGDVSQQPFRPQALAKYSRHFEGPVPQQPVAAHRVAANASRQAAGASVPVEHLHSWTSEVSAVDPFVSAPFHLKAPQEKP